MEYTDYSIKLYFQEKDQMGNNIKQGKNGNKNGEDDMNGNGEETINR